MSPLENAPSKVLGVPSLENRFPALLGVPLQEKGFPSVSGVLETTFSSMLGVAVLEGGESCGASVMVSEVVIISCHGDGELERSLEVILPWG